MDSDKQNDKAIIIKNYAWVVEQNESLKNISRYGKHKVLHL